MSYFWLVLILKAVGSFLVLTMTALIIELRQIITNQKSLNYKQLVGLIGSFTYILMAIWLKF